MVPWLLGAGLGPAAVAVPVNWAADALAGAAQRWFKRLRRTDDLSRLVRAATGSSVDLTQAEFNAVRKLLEDQQTWNVAGRGTVEDLATRIADRLPPRDGRTAEDSAAAALTIARGLIEFAVADLEPKLFQQVLMARLQRMETGQESKLDKALLGLHARFDSVMDQLKLVLDQLPPGPARRGEIEVYLRTLIDWLSADPWPRDPQFGGPVLTPAAIERKLRVTATGRDGEQDLDADELAHQCGRLVILGGPGSGKTWLAKRAVRRCAENAREILAAGGTLEEVELPLYTTCSRLFGADGDIREAVVSSALGQIGDLGGSRISKALGVFFAERNAPTLLVIDSLDEAHGPSERLRQADTLPFPWRIVLTSRASSWRHQLTVNDTDGSHRVGELQPLHYPGDVEPFIERWFAGQPGQGNDLAAQIARRPGLQKAATVPLMLAFYCIIGGTGPLLPKFRRDLYTKVLNRMLTGRWRDDDDRQPDPDTCLQTLRAWAWDGATSHPVSGIGTWADDISAKRARLGEADADAVDHISTPLGPSDVDTGMTLRRFIHRSVREHLVAGHVASLPVDQAVKVLLPHLWYDPDWEYAAPAAIAMHPQRDQLVRDLICRAARSDQIPGNLSVIDARWEFRGLLARVAAESSETDWSPEVAAMIGQARVELARSGRFGDLGGTAHWATSDRQARDALLALLARETRGSMAASLAGGVAQLDPRAEDKRQARGALLALLARETDSWVAAWLVGRVAQLATTAEDKRLARGALLALLARETHGWVADQTSGRADETRVWVSHRARGQVAASLAGGVAQLATTAEDKRLARGALLALLARETHGWVADQTSGRADETRVWVSHRARGQVAASLAGGVAQLDPTAEDKRQARGALLALLARETDRWGVAETRGQVAASLAGGVAQLDPTAEDKRQARGALLALLARETDNLDETRGLMAESLVGGVAQLATTAEDKRQARDALLALLARKTDSLVADLTSGQVAASLAGGVAQLATTAEDKRQARDALLALLARETSDLQHELAVAQLDPMTEDKRQARDALLGLLALKRNGWVAASLASGVAQLDPTAEDKRQARDALLALLARETDSPVARVLVAASLAGEVAQLDPTAEDKRQGRGALLALLASETTCWVPASLVSGVAQLSTTAEDKRQARDVLLARLACATDSWLVEQLADGVAQLDPTAEDKRQARGALLALLARETTDRVAASLAGGVAQLDPTAEDKRQARSALLARLACATDSWLVEQLAGGVARLDPTVHDLRTWRAWAVPPTAELLAAVRRNSALTNWLAALPSLTSLSGSPPLGSDHLDVERGRPEGPTGGCG